MPTSKKTAKRKASARPLPRAGLKLIKIGLILWLVFAVYRAYELKLLSFSGQIGAHTSSGPAAINIQIPQVNLSLPVTEATVSDGTWEISPNGASHWDSSANPGDSGNIVLYGHNKTNLFGPIRWLNLGEEIILTAANGQKYRYTIISTQTVSPNQTEFIEPKTEEILTLYTCTGLFDSQRYVVIAVPI